MLHVRAVDQAAVNGREKLQPQLYNKEQESFEIHAVTTMISMTEYHYLINHQTMHGRKLV